MTRRLAAIIVTLALLTMGAATATAQMQQDNRLELPPVDRAAARTTQGARDLAIVIAVENYQSLSGVPGAVLTGMDWKVFFSEHLGMSDDRIMFLKDHMVTPSKLEREIPTFLKKADTDARVWFVFIGHGAPYQAVEGNSQISDGLLVGVNAFNDTYADFIDGSLRKSKLEQMLAAGRQKQTVMILDACFSGKTPYNQNLTGTQAVIPSKVIPKVGPQDIVFSAAAHNEVANLVPGNTTKRPAFSYVLLGALRGWGDRDGDQQVSLAEAEAYSQRALLGLQTPSASVGDNSVRDVALVENAPENDPGADRLFQPTIRLAKTYSNRPCDTAGKVRNADTQGECCWPGQAFSSMSGSCVGSPMCPDGMALGDDGDCQKAAGPNAFAAAVDRSECSSAARCEQIADDALLGRHGEIDNAKAMEFYQKACDAGSARSCLRLGGILFSGVRGIPKERARAVPLLQKACDAGLQDGCVFIASLYLSGQGVPIDRARAQTLYEQACDAGHMGGCSSAAVNYAGENRAAYDRFRQRAATLAEEACDNGNGRLCMEAARFSAAGLQTTRTAEEFRRSAVDAFQRECDEGGVEAGYGCWMLGKYYEYGEFHLDQDLGRALALFQRGCDLGGSVQCARAAELHEEGKGVPQDAALAINLYQLSCDRGWDAGCDKVTEVRNQQACDNGDTSACPSSQPAIAQTRPSSGGCAGGAASGFVVVFLFGLGGAFRRRWF